MKITCHTVVAAPLEVLNEIVATPHLLFEKHAAREYASQLVLDGRYKKSNDKYLAVF